MTRLDRFMSRRWKSETQAGANKYAESIVEHADCDGRCGWSNLHTPQHGSRQSISVAVVNSARVQCLVPICKGQTTKQLETRPSRRL